MTHKILLVLSLVVTGVSFAQLSSSPYGKYGIGEPGNMADGFFGGIGNTSVAVMDSTTVNFSNPSSYVELSDGQPLFSIGISSRISNYTEDGTKSRGTYTHLNQLGMVLPVKKYLGLAFGLQPFSRRGYSIFLDDANDPELKYNYSGSGTTNYVFGGIALKILNQSRNTLSFGANYGGIFGTVTNMRYSYSLNSFDEPAGGGAEETSFRIHSGYLNLGLNYSRKLDREGNHQLRLGANYIPQQKLSAHRDFYFFFSDTNVFNPNTYSVLTSTLDDKGKIIYPSTTSVGFNYMFRPLINLDYKRKSVYQLNIFGEFTTTDWSSYAIEFREKQENGGFSNTQRFSIGAQFAPNYNAHDKQVGQSYLKKVRYRVGGYFGTMPYTQNGAQVTENGVTAGFGLPFANQRTNSSVNLSFQYGSRGTESGLKETFYGINVGVVIAPARYDMWFRKRKVD